MNDQLYLCLPGWKGKIYICVIKTITSVLYCRRCQNFSHVARICWHLLS